MGTDACGNGYPAALPGLRASGDASPKTSRKRISEVFISVIILPVGNQGIFCLRSSSNYDIISDCDT